MKLSLEALLDRQLYIVLRDIKNLTHVGVTQEQFIGILRGFDERQGIWVETVLRDCPVKADGIELDDCMVEIFIPWYHIVTMVNFPGRDTLEISLKKERKIGFRQE